MQGSTRVYLRNTTQDIQFRVEQLVDEVGDALARKDEELKEANERIAELEAELAELKESN